MLTRFENDAYNRGFALWLVGKDSRQDLLAWSPKIDIALAAFQAAVKLLPGEELSLRQRGRVVQEIDRHGKLANR